MEGKHEAKVKTLAALSAGKRSEYRLKVYRDTKRACESPDIAGLLREPRPFQVNSYADIHLEPSPNYPTQVIVFNGDCLEAAHQLFEKGLRPAVLNMASEKHPGGGVERGSGAQEENLFRRTDYFRHLNKNICRYPMEPSGGVYSPEVLVLKASEADDYTMLPNPVHFDMVAVAAIRRPEVEKRDGKVWLVENAAQLTKDKMKTVLGLASLHQNDAIILSAFGCGAFKNPPEHIAMLFQEVLQMEEYQGRFRVVVFAIFDDHNARQEHNPDGNLVPFEHVFGSEIRTDLSNLEV